MEGKGPYRIYDPGGSEVKARDEVIGGSSYRQLLEENSMLRERMKGLKSLGRFQIRTCFCRIRDYHLIYLTGNGKCFEGYNSTCLHFLGCMLTHTFKNVTVFKQAL